MKALLAKRKLWPAIIAAMFPLLTFALIWTIFDGWQRFTTKPVETLASLCFYLFLAGWTSWPFLSTYEASKRNQYVRRGFYFATTSGLIATAIVWSAIAYNTYTDYDQPLTGDPAGAALSLLAMIFSPFCIWILMQVVLIITLPLFKSR